MSSIVSRGTDATMESISRCERRKSDGDQPSKRSDSSRTARSPRCLTSAMIAATVSCTFAFAASLSAAGRAFLRYVDIRDRYSITSGRRRSNEWIRCWRSPFRRKKLSIDNRNHDVIGIDHLGQVNARDFRQQLVRIELGNRVVLLDPRHEFRECDAERVIKRTVRANSHQ